ncbi:hypothetical protein DJ71_14155 [Halorubrum sp. E3]|uniref:Uncharacterized protein n=1 Tax=Halorubrum persicum TaxID=1383844 RepID=A0A2G1WNR8_9EURY|nr:hypothetical protein [Halorubrum persicum]OYR80873.1 hypothetical protein DJ71_14155 [Halorubrum sp. E3]PHQ40519.1 hypothetical protein DJ69_00660 [Halorubrum persicum]
MQQRRRTILASLGTVAGLAGCLNVDGVTYPDELDNRTDSDGNNGTSSDDGTDRVTGPHPSLAAATRAVVADAVWFAVSYENAIEVYREAISDVLATVSSLRESINEPTTPTVDMVEQLEAAGYDAADRAATALEPYFYPAHLIRSRTDTHIPALTRSAHRNDADRFVEELDRMHLSFFQIRTPIYISDRFSRDPIHNRLLDRLAPSAPGRVFVELAIPDRRNFMALAYEPYADDSDSYPPTFTGDPLPEARRMTLRERLGPVTQSTGRTEELFCTFAARPDAASRQRNAFEGPPGDLDGTPLYIQQYSDSATASDRLDSILNAGDTEGREPIAPESATSNDTLAWHRYYHREAGSDRTDLDEFAGVQYGYLLQAGEFLLATGFSGDAWEERPRWQGQLTNSWVIPSLAGTSEDGI